MIEFIGVGETYYVHINALDAGTLEMKEDGYYDWYPKRLRGGGYIPAYILRAIADKLDELNKDWDKQVQLNAGQL